jgi:predicted MFS family arabinose efflux permease
VSIKYSERRKSIGPSWWTKRNSRENPAALKVFHVRIAHIINNQAAKKTAMSASRIGAVGISSVSPPRTASLPIALIAWAFVGIALHVGMARFTYGIMLPGLQRDLVLGYASAGALNSAHLLGFLLGTLLAPGLGARRGMPRLSRHAHLLVVAGALVCAIAPVGGGATSLLAFATGRLATGLGAGAGMVAILVLVFAAVPATVRAGVSAVVFAGMGVAVVLSGVAAPWLVETTLGWRAAFVAAALLAALLAFSFPSRTRTTSAAADMSTPAAGPGFCLRSLLGPELRLLVTAYLFFGGAYIAYSTFAGARLTTGHASITVVSATWITFGVAIIVGALLMIPVLRMPGLRRFALPGALAAGAAGAWIAAGEGGAAALAGACTVGLGVASTPALVTALVRERVGATAYALAHSYVSAALGIGQFVGPVLAGAIADVSGPAAVPLLAAAVYTVAAGLALFDSARIRGSSGTEEPAA